MVKKQLDKGNEITGKEPLKITFKCGRCAQYKPLEEMRTIRRFFPVLVVCRDCEKEIR